MPDPNGPLWEVPIHTQLVPFWQMLGRKRLKLQSKTRSASKGSPLPHHWRGHLLRYRYPRKLDFCRMTFEEMRETVGLVLKRRRLPEQEHSVLVAIGHSKDFVDSEAVRRFLAFLEKRAIPVTTFSRLLCQDPPLFS